MADTGRSSWIGFPPQVRVTERMLIRDVPEEERPGFLAFLGDKTQYTRSGEAVFPKALYEQWKRVH